MKKIISTGILFFSIAILNSQTFPVETLKNNGATNKRINLVMLGDGYLSSEQTQYITNATNVVNGMFGQSPFSNYEPFFNVFAIKVPSVESGAKHAGTATDVTEPASPITNPNNYFGSRFDVSNIHRLLAPANSGAVFTTLANNFPDYDQIFVLVNSSVYGGSGGTFATSSTHVSASEIAIHEIGHSFANLGDEYWFNCGERKNRSANNNPATVIWKNWIGSNSIGIYTIEGSSPNCYRPHPNCKMKVLGAPFCSVCKEAFIDKIYALVSPIDHFAPLGNTVDFVGPSMGFSLGLILPNPNTLKIQWVLNGATIANDVDNVSLSANALNIGSNTLTANVTDATTLSRAYLPATSGYLHAVTWTVNKIALPLELLDFDAHLVESQVVLRWKTASESNSDFFDLQKSADGSNFRRIGTVKAAGQSASLLNYRFTDAEPLDGATYYRLGAVDLDGKTTLSPIKVVNRIDKVRYEIYPNPVSHTLTVQLSAQRAAAVELSLFDVQGRRLAFVERPAAEAFVEEIEMGAFAVGSYVLRVKMGEYVLERTIVKQ